MLEQFFLRGGPQRPILPVYIDGFAAYRLSSCDPDGIFPVRLLYDKSMKLKNVKFDRLAGISAERLLLEKSSDSKDCMTPILLECPLSALYHNPKIATALWLL